MENMEKTGVNRNGTLKEMFEPINQEQAKKKATLIVQHFPDTYHYVTPKGPTYVWDTLIKRGVDGEIEEIRETLKDYADMYVGELFLEIEKLPEKGCRKKDLESLRNKWRLSEKHVTGKHVNKMLDELVDNFHKKYEETLKKIEEDGSTEKRFHDAVAKHADQVLAYIKKKILDGCREINIEDCF